MKLPRLLSRLLAPLGATLLFTSCGVGLTPIGINSIAGTPAISGLSFTPPSPSNNATPVLKGVLSAVASAAKVSLFSDASCSTLLAQVPAATFTGTGVPISVALNASTSIFGQLSNLPGVCTLLGTYLHDSVAPSTPTLTAPLPSSSTTLTFSFAATDSGSGVSGFTCQLDGATSTLCSSPMSYTGLSAGSHTLVVKASDAAQNISATSSASAQVMASNQFHDTAGALATIRVSHTATLLGNGKVLVAGGTTDLAPQSLATSELFTYDGSFGSFSAGPPMIHHRYGHTATLLNNGKVLIVGGIDQTDTTLNQVELYDPVSNTFTASSATLTTPRSSHSATLLADGRVFIFGGEFDGGGAISTGQIYNPVTDSFGAEIDSLVGRESPPLSLLPDGRVLLSGGFGDAGEVNSVSVFNPLTLGYTALTVMQSVRERHLSLTLPNGKVLIVGGDDAQSVGDYFNTVELYDPSGAGSTTALANLSSNRTQAVGAVLPSGKVIVISGFDGTIYPATADLYDPSGAGSTVSVSTVTPSNPNGRWAPQLVQLANGTLLIVGGFYAGLPINNAQLYFP